jgi:hypothetical protein
MCFMEHLEIKMQATFKVKSELELEFILNDASNKSIVKEANFSF